MLTKGRGVLETYLREVHCEQPLTHQIVNSQWVVKDATQGCFGRTTELKLHFEDGLKSSLAMMMIVKPLNLKRFPLLLLSLTSYMRGMKRIAFDPPWELQYVFDEDIAFAETFLLLRY